VTLRQLEALGRLPTRAQARPAIRILHASPILAEEENFVVASGAATEPSTLEHDLARLPLREM
jgi:hypothetical protein